VILDRRLEVEASGLPSDDSMRSCRCRETAPVSAMRVLGLFRGYGGLFDVSTNETHCGSWGMEGFCLIVTTQE
jgi:hypothetical protein